MSLAVISSTIGRPSLRDCLASVRAQTVPVQHYVFVDGRQHWPAVEALRDEFPEVHFIFLPLNTGGDSWKNSFINPAAAFLVAEDLICFLDDDNRYAPWHAETLLRAAEAFPDVDFFYTLRWLTAADFCCEDNFESLGFWRVPDEGVEIPSGLFQANRGFMVDVNCMALRRDLAQRSASLWCQHRHNDAFLFQTLAPRIPMLNTAARSVYYRLNMAQFLTGEGIETSLRDLEALNAAMVERPWLTPTLAWPEQGRIILEALPADAFAASAVAGPAAAPAAPA